MSKLSLLNLLAIDGLEKAGLANPNEKQIGCVETCLKDVIIFISATVFVLDEAGVTEPSVNEMRKILKDYYQNMSWEKINVK